MIRVAVVDDQALVRAGFRKLLEPEGDLEVVGEAGDGIEIVELCHVSSPDVVLMDIRMPRMDGLEATRRITANSGGVKVIILTTYDMDEYVFDALKAGASGFLLKDSPPDDLLSAIRTVARGDALLAPTITRRLIAEFVRRPYLTLAPQLDELTPREMEVLRLLASGNSNSEIASELFLGEATIKTHVGHILAKLALRDRVQAVVFAYESGLVQPGNSPA